MILGQQTRKNFTQNPKNDILSGLTVALALVPEAVAFAFVAGVDPLVGLYGAFMMGIVTALFGGRPGMISGATGAMAVVMVHLIQKGNEAGLALDIPAFTGGKYTHLETKEARRRIKNVPYRVKATKAKLPEPEIEAEDDLVIDDDDNLDLIDHGDK